MFKLFILYFRIVLVDNASELKAGATTFYLSHPDGAQLRASEHHEEQRKVQAAGSRPPYDIGSPCIDTGRRHIAVSHRLRDRLEVPTHPEAQTQGAKEQHPATVRCVRH